MVSNDYVIIKIKIHAERVEKMIRDNIYYRSPKKVLKYYYLTEGLLLLVGVIIGIALILLTHYYNWWNAIHYIVIVGMVVDVFYFVVTPVIKYKFTFYKIETDYVAISKQFFFKKTELVKFERTQIVNRKSNPVLDILGLSKTSINTAGHVVNLPLIQNKDAETVETSILSYLRGADFDV